MMNRMYSRRQIWKFGVSGLAATGLLALAGCGGSPTNNSGKTELDFVFWGAAARDEMTRKAIAAFEEANKDITISSQFLPFDQYWNRLNTQIAGNSMPDIIQMDMRYLLQYAQRNLLFDMTPSTSNDALNLGDFDTTLLDSSKVDGKIFGVPLGGNYIVNTYNATRIQALGVGEPPADMTWESFADYARELTAALPEGSFGAGNPMDFIAFFEMWVRQRGRELYNADGSPGMEKDDIASWFEYWTELVASKGAMSLADQISIASGGGPSDNSLVQGRTLLNVSLSNSLEASQSLMEDQLALSPCPLGEQPGFYFKPSMLISISEKTDHSEEAVAFIDFLINNDDAVIALGMDRGIPGSEKARQTLTPELSSAQQEVLRFSETMKDNPNVRPRLTLDPPGAGQVEADFKRHAQSVALEGRSPGDAADAFLIDAQKAITQG